MRLKDIKFTLRNKINLNFISESFNFPEMIKVEKLINSEINNK